MAVKPGWRSKQDSIAPASPSRLSKYSRRTKFSAHHGFMKITAETRALDLTLAIPISAIGASVTFALLSGLNGPSLAMGVIELLKAMVFMLLLFLPIALLAAIPAYFALRRLKRLGALECTTVGAAMGVIFAIGMPAKDVLAGMMLSSVGAVAGAAAFAVLAVLSRRRTLATRRCDAQQNGQDGLPGSSSR